MRDDDLLHPGLGTKTRRVVLGLVGFATALGFLGTAGWFFDSSGLRTFGSDRAQMVPLSALCTVLLGVAVGVWCAPIATRAATAVSAIAAGGVAGVAVLVLVEHVSEIDFGFDAVLWRSKVEAAGQLHPGRPSAQTTVGLLLVAVSVLIAVAGRRRPRRNLAALVGVIGASVGAQALTGYLLGAEAFYGSSAWGADGMSISSALGIVALGVGVALLAAEDSLRDLRSDPGAWHIAVRLLPAALLVPLIRAAAIQVTLTPGGRSQVLTVLVGAAALAVLVGLVWSASEAIRRIDEQRDQLIERLPVAAALVDHDGIVVHANPAAIDLLGIPGPTLVGAKASTVLGTTDAALEDLRRRALAGDTPTSAVACDLARGAATIEITAQAIEWDSWLAALMVLVDRSEQIRHEEALRLAKAEAERANSAKSKFLSGMSHELRTPLNAILGFAQLLQLDELTPSQRDASDTILKAGHHLLKLIDEVLELSRIESGALNLSPEAFSLTELVQEAVDLVRPIADSASITFVDDTRETCDRYVLADRQRAKQILLNLLSNAVKYNCQRGTVAVTCGSANTGTVRMSVADTGVGLSADQIDLLFSPFERLGAESTNIEGTGIGLVVCKQLAEAMGGRMGVASTRGKGSTFWCELPEVEAPMDRFERLQPATADKPPPSSAAGSITIVHIDDNPVNLKLIERVLDTRAQPCTVIPAMKGRLGLELAREHQPSIILLDLHLPDMHGDEVLQHLRDDPTTRSIPVVIISADATTKEIQRLLDAGAAAYITKPIDVHELLAVIDSLVAAPRVQQ